MCPSDRQDADPIRIEDDVIRFKRRLTVLFIDGVIMSDAMQDTFTAEVLSFIRKPDILYSGKRTQLFAMPTSQDDLFEPLERVRQIVRTVLAWLDAALPSCSWQLRFASFKLPSAFGQVPADNERCRVEMQGQVRSNLRVLFEQAHIPWEQAFQ